MTKQLIHAYIDTPEYVSLRSLKINISELVRDLLKKYLENTQEPQIHKLEGLKQDLGGLLKKKEDLLNDILILKVKIEELEKEELKKRAEEEANNVKMVKAMKNQGALRDII